MICYARYKNCKILFVALFVVVLFAISGCGQMPYEPDLGFENESDYANRENADLTAPTVLLDNDPDAEFDAPPDSEALDNTLTVPLDDDDEIDTELDAPLDGEALDNTLTMPLDDDDDDDDADSELDASPNSEALDNTLTVPLDDDDDTDAALDTPPDSEDLDNVVDAWITAGMDFFRDITGRFDSTGAFIEENYAHNRMFDFDGFIFDQRAADARNLRFGSGAMWRNNAQINPGEGWGWYNGCGWVATYNAALLLDKEYHPAYIIRYFELLGGAVADGIFGLNPIAIDTFFLNRGVTTNTHNLPTTTDDIIRSSTVSVLTYIRSDGGAHIVTIYYDNATEMFRVFNDWTAGSTRTSPGELHSVDEWLQSDNNDIWQTLTVTTLG